MTLLTNVSGCFSCEGSSTNVTQPGLVTFSGRTAEGLSNVLDQVQNKHSHDIELQALLQEFVSTPSSAHPYRGYALLNHEGKIKDVQASVFLNNDPSFLLSAMFLVNWWKCD